MKDYQRLTARDAEGNAQIIGKNFNYYLTCYSETSEKAIERLCDLEDMIERGDLQRSNESVETCIASDIIERIKMLSKLASYPGNDARGAVLDNCVHIIAEAYGIDLGVQND